MAILGILEEEIKNKPDTPLFARFYGLIDNPYII
jgi:hypothetical protein